MNKKSFKVTRLEYSNSDKGLKTKSNVVLVSWRTDRQTGGLTARHGGDVGLRKIKIAYHSDQNDKMWVVSCKSTEIHA